MALTEAAGTVKAPKACYEEPPEVSAKSDYYKGITKLMKLDDDYIAIAAKLDAADVKIEAFKVKILIAQSGAAGTASARNVAEDSMRNDMDSILADVQVVANNDPVNAITNITKLGISYRTRTGYTREAIEVRHGTTSGSFELWVKKPNGEFAVVWFFTTTPAIAASWVMADFSHNTRGDISGLVKGTIYYFKAKVSSSVDGKSDWTQVIDIVCI